MTGTEIPLESKDLKQLFRSIIDIAVKLNNKKLEIEHSIIDTIARRVCLSGQDARPSKMGNLDTRLVIGNQDEMLSDI